MAIRSRTIDAVGRAHPFRDGLRVPALIFLLVVTLPACRGPGGEPVEGAPASRSSSSQPSVPGSRYDASGFPESAGRSAVIAHCTGCHSGKLVQQNRATRVGWKEIIRWMQRKQGLWELDPATEDQILTYLASQYGPSTEAEVVRRPPLAAGLMPPEPELEKEER